MKQLITNDDVMAVLDACYDKCLNGVSKVSGSVDRMAYDYIMKYETTDQACKAMLRNQITKCTTSGFLTGFGGIITIPVTLPANITSVLYVQMRMIACVASMAGYKLDSDQTKTFVYACLAGVALNGFVKDAGIKASIKVATNLIEKIPGTTLKKINNKIGYTFITKFGKTGTINLGRMVPIAGAVVGGSLDLIETKIIADRAYKWFFENDFSVKKK